MASPRVNKGEPHCGQKLRAASAPLLARTEYVFGIPLTCKSASATMKPEANGAPLERWQSRQWPLSIATGAREHAYRIAPQAHPPKKGAVISKRPWLRNAAKKVAGKRDLVC